MCAVSIAAMLAQVLATSSNNLTTAREHSRGVQPLRLCLLACTVLLTSCGGKATGADCPAGPTLVAGPQHALRARSVGFAGTDEEYSELYDLPCSSQGDCVSPCVDRGGTEDFCSASVCQGSGAKYCLPPTKWRALSELQSEGTSIDDAAVTSLSLANGSHYDYLIGDNFEFELPASAWIDGIAVTIRRAADAASGAADQAVRIVRGGMIGDLNHARTTPWDSTFEAVEYGGPTDLWGEAWTPAVINSPDFGVAIAVTPASGGRAYVDAIQLTVHHRSCERP